LKPVNMRWSGIALALGLALLGTTGADAAPKKHKKAKPAVKAKAKAAKPWTGAENSLVGIKLYDSGLHVIDVYGTPDDIQALNYSSGGATGSGAPGGGTAGPGGPGGPPAGFGGAPKGSGGGGAPSNAGAASNIPDPFDLGDTVLEQAGRGMPGGRGRPGGPNSMGGPPPGVAGPGGGRNGGFPGGPPGVPGGGPGGPGGPGAGGGAPAAGGGATDRVTFTRWVYNRDGSKYAFIIDKAGRVVQIEAIGLDNGRVKTKRGIGFGSTFASIIRNYSQPDGYEIGGENLMIKYLVHDNVAFRLSRLGTKKPQVVTGIVVAAGKS